MTAPKPQPHPYVVINEDGAAVGIDWESLINTELIKREGADA